MQLLEDGLTNAAKGNEKVSENIYKESILKIRKTIYSLSNESFSPILGSKEKLFKQEAIDEFAQKIKELDTPLESAPKDNTPTHYNVDNIPDKKSKTNMATPSIILGAIGIVAAWLLAFVGWILGGISLGYAISSKKNSEEKSGTALAISVIALLCSFISSAIGVIRMI